MKKGIALLCILLILATTFVSASSESTDNMHDKFSIVSALGIDNGSVSGFVTKDYYISSLMGFFYENGDKPSVENFARYIGIVDYGKSYNGKENLTVDEAFKYAVIALGYKPYAEETGNYSGLISKLGLTEGVTGLGNAMITAPDCKTILYNMLECEPMIAVISDGEVSYKIDENETLLSKYRGISRIRGKVTADEYTSLSGEYGCDEGYICIDNIRYRYAVEIDEVFLGKNVEAYIKYDRKSSDEPVVLYIGENKNKNREVIIEADDIDKMVEDYSEIYYYSSGNNRKTLKIDAVPKVIYNGVFYDEYQQSDFKPETGSIRVIDNNSDGKYDIIFIYSYDTVIVSATDTDNKKIYGKHFDKPIVLEPKGDDSRYHISDGMSEMMFSDIKISDVLSIAQSKSKENKTINIFVSREYVSGVFASLDNNDKEIKIDNDWYGFAPAFLRFKESESRELERGMFGTFYLDIFGDVVAWSGSAEDGYVVLYNVDGEKFDLKHSLTYMNMNGEWLEVPIANKINYNEYKYTSADSLDKLKAIRGQIVKIKVNSAGEIKSVETALETTKYEENRFTKTPVSEYTWRSALKSFNCEYFLDKGAKVIVMPVDIADKDAYQVREPGDYFKSDEKYIVSMYDCDEYNFTNLVSMTYVPRINDTLLVVKSVGETCINGEVLDLIEGCTSDYQNITVVGEDDEIFDSISEGDVVKISLNAIGRADETETVYRLKGDFIQKSVSTIYQSRGELAGTVLMIDKEKERIQVMCNGVKYNFRVDGTTKVLKYYTEENEIEICNYLSILPENEVFIRLQWGKVQDIIIRK